ncbi:MAG: S8/S53 family peptidase, partial [Acidimicrobiia bacterium]
PDDEEAIGNKPTEASHGTFVTSLIRQLAPEISVSFARATTVPIAEIVGRNEDLPPGVSYVSTELHVAAALVRLAQRDLPDNATVPSLNLSLGTYTCDPGSDPLLLATNAGLDIWAAAHPESLVFAAGGNELNQTPFWPGALTSVDAVAAVDTNGDQVVWAEDAATGAVIPHPGGGRPWINDTAPGCDLLGLRGGTDQNGATVVAWSGSSFATAVASALHAREPLAIPPPKSYTYADSGVTYDDLGSC